MAVPIPSRIAHVAQDRKLAGQGCAGQRDGLEQHAAGDEGLAAEPVGQGTGDQLAQAPDGRIQRSQQADLADGRPPRTNSRGSSPRRGRR